MMKKSIIITLLSLCPILSIAQEVYIKADLVSEYIWRGIKTGNTSFQPEIGATWRGLSLSAWGSTEFRDGNKEVSLFLKYKEKQWEFTLMDCFYQAEGFHGKYFNYALHTYEAGIHYTMSKKLPLTISWYTYFAGNDYLPNGNRAWSSYLLLNYPFQVKGVDLKLQAGLTPWEGTYGKNACINNIGLTVSKAIQITDKFSLPIFGSVIVNPYDEHVFFVMGLSL